MLIIPVWKLASMNISNWIDSWDINRSCISNWYTSLSEVSYLLLLWRLAFTLGMWLWLVNSTQFEKWIVHDWVEILTWLQMQILHLSSSLLDRLKMIDVSLMCLLLILCWMCILLSLCLLVVLHHLFINMLTWWFKCANRTSTFSSKIVAQMDWCPMYLLQFFNLNIFCYFFIIQEFLWWRLDCAEICGLVHTSKFFILLLSELLLAILDRNSLFICFIFILILILFNIMLLLLVDILVIFFLVFFFIFIILSLLLIHLLNTSWRLASTSIIGCCPLWSLQLLLILIFKFTFLLMSTTWLFLLLLIWHFLNCDLGGYTLFFF